MPGVLVLAATPIGDVSDASPRLARELAVADVVAAEDTRRLRRLCRSLGVDVTARVVSYHDQNEAARTAELVDALRARGTGAAGHRCRHAVGVRSRLSAGRRLRRRWHPGHRRARSERGADRARGQRAAVGPVLLRGLPAAQGRRAGDAGCASLRPSPARWCSSRRRTGSPRPCDAMADAFGADRPAAVCRELTKTYEEVVRGPLAELVQWATHARSAARSPWSSPGPTGSRPHPGRGSGCARGRARGGRPDPQGGDRGCGRGDRSAQA